MIFTGMMYVSLHKRRAIVFLPTIEFQKFNIFFGDGQKLLKGYNALAP